MYEDEELLSDYMCAVCGEYIMDDEPMAEIVWKSDQSHTHHYVHQDPCYNPETMETA